MERLRAGEEACGLPQAESAERVEGTLLRREVCGLPEIPRWILGAGIFDC